MATTRAPAACATSGCARRPPTRRAARCCSSMTSPTKRVSRRRSRSSRASGVCCRSSTRPGAGSQPSRFRPAAEPSHLRLALVLPLPLLFLLLQPRRFLLPQALLGLLAVLRPLALVLAGGLVVAVDAVVADAVGVLAVGG